MAKTQTGGKKEVAEWTPATPKFQKMNTIGSAATNDGDDGKVIKSLPAAGATNTTIQQK